MLCWENWWKPGKSNGAAATRYGVTVRRRKSWAHPIRRLHGAGVRVTVNIDDPLMFTEGAFEETRRRVAHLGNSEQDVFRLQS